MARHVYLAGGGAPYWSAHFLDLRHNRAPMHASGCKYLIRIWPAVAHLLHCHRTRRDRAQQNYPPREDANDSG